VGLTARASRRALVVPDERSWALWGHDLAARGIEPALDPTLARVLVVPERVPDELAESVAELAREAPLAEPLVLPSPWPSGRPTVEVLRAGDAQPGAGSGDDEAGHACHDEKDEEGHGRMDHGGHGQMDGAGGDEAGDEPWRQNMMPIPGEPSRDGLVMEPIEFEHGPLAPALPGGLVVAAKLDGDLVADCVVRATLQAREGDPVPDPLAPAAWGLALRRAGDRGRTGAPDPRQRWLDLAAVELERAVSHAGWLRELGRLLGWAQLSERAGAVVAPLVAAHATPPVPAGHELDRARGAAERLRRLLDGSRRLAQRLRGRGEIASDQARDRGLTGPAARASGLPHDARAHDPTYRALGFQPRREWAGDALARTTVRLGELADALALAAAALARDDAPNGDEEAPPEWVESPRGPIRVRAGRPEAPGASELLAVASDAAVGQEWASALVVIASFDPSPWQPAP
jgi:hypothetical protein